MGLLSCFGFPKDVSRALRHVNECGVSENQTKLSSSEQVQGHSDTKSFRVDEFFHHLWIPDGILLGLSGNSRLDERVQYVCKMSTPASVAAWM